MFLIKYVFFSCVFQQALARNDVLTMKGDIILGGLFDMHHLGRSEKECGEFNEIPGYQYMEAMLYALDKMNSRADVLPGIRLGAIIYDTCRSPTISADRTKEFIKLTLQKSTRNGTELAGVIGPYKSANSITVANFLRVFQIPQISYGSLTVELSKKDIYDYFFRTVPPDNFFAEGIANLAQLLDWNYVSIVYSTGKWSETGASEVRKALRKHNLCIADYLQIDRFVSNKDFDDVIETLAENEQRRVVILVTIQRDCKKLLEAKDRHKYGEQLLFIAGLEWGNHYHVTDGIEKAADGSISFGHREGTIPDFMNYFESIRFNNYTRDNKEWVGEYWQKNNKCKLENFTVPTNNTKLCSGDEENAGYLQLAPVQVVINAIEAMANALHNMQQRLCPNTIKLCDKMRPLNRTLLLEFLRNVTYIDAAFHNPVSFNENQEVNGNYTLFNFRSVGNNSYDFVQVGSWFSTLVNGSVNGTLTFNRSQTRYYNGASATPVSTCKPACAHNQMKVFHEDMCCWECKPCASNDIVVENTCETCKAGFVPSEYFTNCLKLPLRYLNMDTPLSIFFGVMASLGILVDFMVFAVFFMYRESKLIKASGREMCYVIFVGIAALFMVPFTCLAKPTQALCYFRRFITGFSFTICYAPLLMKMWRIHQIFTNSLRNVKISRNILINRRSLLGITSALIAVQGLFCGLVFYTDPPYLIETFYESKKELVLECALNNSAFAIYFIYNVLLLLCCTLYAFRTRNFPKNFNEAMVIGVTMYLTCIIWIIFFATFLNEVYSINHIYWISGCSLLTGWVTLVGLFAPKIYQVLTKAEFSQGMLMKWGDTASPTLDSSTSACENCPRCKMRDAEMATNNGSSKETAKPLELEITSNTTEM